MPIYQRILVPLDGSETSQLGLQEAIRLAQTTQGELRLFHVIDDLSFALAMDAYAGQAADWIGTLRETGARLLEEGRRIAEAAGVKVSVVLHQSYNDKLPDAVAAEARRWPAELIVVGTHGRRGFGRLVLGSGAENILRSAPVPVLLVRPAEEAVAQKAGEAGAQHERVSLPSGALSIERSS
ncbi:universal stress protein [Variovorax sp. OV329]|uniref:universal stress protein n=1 Tax=Variovorax sp. OV329 TaxID=1882825 RepID=UPI0008F1D968|nr:universal stress protein [Variovorax sp. OV329]SFM62747.1 Nucleotide-binding universal stress protein, UspA family [Variovorax sp. OV329]